MKAFSSLLSIIGALALCMFAQSAQAALSCGFFNASRGFDGTMALQNSTVTVPRDAPLGTKIYLQAFNQAGAGAEYQCGTSNATMRTLYNVQGNLVNTGSSANSFYAGKIYKTDVPGIGVAWYAGQGGAPGVAVGAVGTAVETGTIPGGCTAPSGLGIPQGSCRTTPLKFQSTASVVLIKIGPIGPGTIIGSNLGKLVFSASFDDSAAYNVATLGLTGTINIVAQTCRTPDVNVAMGSYKTSAFTGIGSATPQVNFVIPLTDCPGFPGYYGQGSPASALPASSQTEITNAGTPISNTLSIQFDPVATPIDAANGVLSLATGTDATGRSMATGVGVQLLDASGTPRALSQSKQLSVALDANTKAINITLGARYLQTAKTVTAGNANAVATYTIIYQ
ncbi:MAG: Fimbrial adhesin [Frankiales bacterium]|nr:Fimbrial adhesin [Frankiales bacterium]